MNKLEKLQQTKDKLKSEFVGIDKIIDRVIDSITPWYITPEVLERPTVVSLWGLTGTGKTSLIRKLIKYLDLSGKSLFFDCGEQGGDADSRLFSDKLDDLFESSVIKENDPRYTKEDLEKLGLSADQEQGITRTDPLDYVFIFDEFQYLKTKNPSTGEEESRPEGRAIWGLMDSGLVDINRYSFKMKQLIDYYEDMEFFNESHPGVTLKEGKFPESLSPILKQTLSYYRWADDEKKEEKGGYDVIMYEDFSFLIKKLNLLKKGLGFKVGDEIKKLKTLDEFIIFMKDYVNLLSKPKIINCSKSLVFVLGNLDEAFELTGDDLDPDIDADVYHEITSKVTCMDIKTSLRKRFRDEQVGRLGNNIIIYPSLRRKDFQEIIEREVSRISEKFEKHNGIKISVSDNFKRLIYSEGCFPIQGVRPLFSTINYLISPLLSMILMSGKKNGSMILDVKEKNYNLSKATLFIEGVGERKINLNLGELRSPERCKKLGLQAVHEASHAVLYHLLTGKYPSALIASNIFGDGGYMMNEINQDFSTGNIRELKEDVIVSLAGYYGEREFFDKDMCSLGASSDIKNVWENIRDAYYTCGLHIPLSISENYVSTENRGLPFGFPVTDTDINRLLYKFFDSLCEETKRLVKDEKYLIAKISEYLLENRSMGVEEFKKYVEKYMKGSPKVIDENYYSNIIKNYEK